MHKYLLTVFMLLLYSNGISQNANLSKLRTLHIKLKAATESTRTAAFLDLGEFHHTIGTLKSYPKSLDSAVFYARKAEKLSLIQHDKKSSGLAAILLSKSFTSKGEYEKSESYANTAIKIFSETDDKPNIAEAFAVLGAANYDSRELSETIGIQKKAVQLFEELGNKDKEALARRELGQSYMSDGKMQDGIEELERALATYKAAGEDQVQKTYSLIGIASDQMGDHKTALEYGLKAVQLAEENNDTSGDAAEIYNYAAMTYYHLKQTEKASTYFQKAYTIAKKYNGKGLSTMILTNLIRTLTTLKKYREAVVYLKEMEKDFNEMGFTAQNMLINRCIVTYTDLEEYKKATPYVNMAVARAAKLNSDDQNLTLLYPGIVMYYRKTKQYDLTRKYAELNLALNKKIRNMIGISEMHRTLFTLDSLKSDFESALKHYKFQKIYSDSLYHSNKSKEIAELQIQYDTEKKDKDLLSKDKALLLKDKKNLLLQKDSDQANLIKNISLGGLLLFFSILLLLYNRYRTKQKINTILEQQKDEINFKNKNLEKLVSEKEWLLKEVHHRVKNNLQMVMSLLYSQSHYLTDIAAKKAIKDSQHRIHSMSLIHKKLYQSDNVVTIKMDIYVAELIEYFRLSFGTGQRIRFTAEIEDVELDTNQAVPIGLIINEGITNSIKHAFPEGSEGLIKISLAQSPENRITLSISDDGTGDSNYTADKEFSSLGMKLIKGLTEDLNGVLTIDNENGYTLSIVFPYDEKLLRVKKNDFDEI